MLHVLAPFVREEFAGNFRGDLYAESFGGVGQDRVAAIGQIRSRGRDVHIRCYAGVL